MIDVMDADQALDAVADDLVLLCFARHEDILTVSKFLERYVRTKAVRAVRVEPTVEAAKTLQLSKYPTFILYDHGNERLTVVGTSNLIEAIERHM